MKPFFQFKNDGKYLFNISLISFKNEYMVSFDICDQLFE